MSDGGDDGRGVRYDLASGTFSSGKGGGRSEEQIAEAYEDAMERMRTVKALGNKLLTEEQYSKALAHYEHAGTFLHGEEMMDVDLGNSDARRDELVAARLTLLLNMAQALLKTATDELVEGLEDEKRAECLEGAVGRCDQALKLDAKSTKALYRRASAREHLGLLELAEEDLRACRELAPKDRQVRTALARVALGARTERAQREAGFRGSLPPPPTPTPPSRAVQCCRRWGPPALAAGCARCCKGCGQKVQSGATLDLCVFMGVAVLSAAYCAWNGGVGAMDSEEVRSHAIALVGLLLGSCVWAYDGGFREGKGVFGDAVDPQSNLSARGGAAGQGQQQQSAPKIKVLDKNGNTKFEYQAKPGEFGVQFKE